MAEGSSGHHPGGNRRPHRTGHHQLHNLSFQPMIEESFPLFTADEEVASERELLKSVEDGPYVSTQFRASPFERALFSALNRVLLIN